MKLTVLLSLIFIQASTAAQTVTLRVKEAPLFEVLAELRKQTNIYFSLSTEAIKEAKPVTVNVRNVPLTEALSRCLQNQNLDYKIIDAKTILITTKHIEPKNIPVKELSNDGYYLRVSGNVISDKGESLPSATIRVRRGKSYIEATITGAKGDFSLNKVQEGDEIVFSFTGFASQTIVYNGQKFMQVIMAEAVSDLDKVTIIGYGTTTERFNTGSSTTVKSEEIRKQPVPNVLQTLQGKVPGLVITQTNGHSSAPFQVVLRGRSTIDKSAPVEPLYIVDGVPLTVLNLTTIGAQSNTSPGFFQNGIVGPAGGQSPIYSINPSDIESVTVLKDGDATAIYGSRGANGVIIINTKKGIPGKTRFEVSGSYGVRFVSKFYDLLNTKEYLELRREGYRNDGVDPTLGDGFDLLVWDTTRYTNWQKFSWGGKAKNVDIQLGLTGGDKRTTFRIGAGYQRSTSLNDFTGKDQRGSFQFNLTHKGLNERFVVSLSSMYSHAQNNLIGLGSGVMLPPNAPAVFDSAGNVNFEDWRLLGGSPFGYLLQPFVTKNGFLNSQLRLEYRIIKGLVVSANIGYSNNNGRQMYQFPIASQDPVNNPVGKLQVGSVQGSRVIIEPQVQYLKQIGKGDFSATAGFSYQGVTQDGFNIVGDGYTNDNLIGSIRNALSVTSSDVLGEYKYLGTFARMNYNYDRKYIINVTARRDGSSKFGPRKQFGNFGSVGAAWLISEEKFFEPVRDIMSFAKLRFSYGYTGSDVVGDYKYLTRWNYTGRPYLNSITYTPTQHANPDLQWQVDQKIDVALSMGFFADKHTINIGLYRNRISNQLIVSKLPNMTGFNQIAANSPATVQNKGLEISSSHKVYKGKEIEIDLNFNIGLNRNKLLSFPNLETSPYAFDYIIGRPLNIQKTLKYLGVDPETGFYTFEDANKDGIIDPYSADENSDLVSIKDLSVQYDGGFGGEVRFKGITLSFGFGFRKVVGKSALFASPYLGPMGNQPTKAHDRWKKPGDKSLFAKASAVGNREDFVFIQSSDVQYRDASFLRLNNASFEYALPASLSKAMGAARLSVFARGQNLFVLSSYDGIDPEVPGIGQLPPLTTIVFGINIGL